MRLLVIEDNRQLVANLFDYFEARGHVVDAAPDGVTWQSGVNPEGFGNAELVRRRVPKYEGYVVPVASGLIAGESLMGIAVTMLTTAGISLAL